VTTIEGIAASGANPVREAWNTLDVPQCGYCQSGMIMATVAFLAKTPHPTDADIDRSITNLCRCATYVRIRAAIHMAAGDQI
jgi:isoquinoline 1-oxidoreductase subunit alpha